MRRHPNLEQDLLVAVYCMARVESGSGLRRRVLHSYAVTLDWDAGRRHFVQYSPPLAHDLPRGTMAERYILAVFEQLADRIARSVVDDHEAPYPLTPLPA